MNTLLNESPQYKNRTICIPFEEKEYEKIVTDVKKFRAYLERMIQAFPELFPAEINNGYQMKDIRFSKKAKINLRRIKIEEQSYTVRPAFMMPYMAGHVKEIENVLFLRKFAVPFWALSHVFGRNPMYWYRMEQNIGRNSVVGTTINDRKDIPKHLCADEKHTRINGTKVYAATTVGSDCILGVCISPSAGEVDLKNAYNHFKQEVQILNEDYKPTTVNLDSWKPTQKAWKTIFSRTIIILCFLHIYIKIRDRSKKKHKEIFNIVAEKLWKCYRKKRRQCFSQSIRRLHNWVVEQNAPSVIVHPIKKLRDSLQSYSIAYSFPGSHRTSNMLERIMQRMDRFLFSIRYFHGGNVETATNSIRAWSLIHNFAPFNPGTIKKRKYRCPAEKLNGFRYHDSWLQNFLISASLGGYRTPPQNP